VYKSSDSVSVFDSVFFSDLTDTLSFAVTGLNNFQQYYFGVRAKDSVGNEEDNSIIRSAIPNAKLTIENIFVNSGKTHKDSVYVSFSITVPAQDTIEDLSGYYSTDDWLTYDSATIIRKDEWQSADTSRIILDSIIWKIPSIESNNIKFVLFPNGKSGIGFSDTTMFFSVDSKKPSFAGIDSIYTGENSATVYWFTANDLNPIKYFVYRSVDSANTFDIANLLDTLTAPDTTITISSLDNFRKYFIGVKAADSLGNDSSSVINDALPIAFPVIQRISLDTLAAFKDSVPFIFSLHVPQQDTVKIIAQISINSDTAFQTHNVNFDTIAFTNSDSAISSVWYSLKDTTFESAQTKIILTPKGKAENAGVSVTSSQFCVDNKPPNFSGLDSVIWDSNSVDIKLQWSEPQDLSSPITYFIFYDSNYTSLLSRIDSSKFNVSVITNNTFHLRPFNFNDTLFYFMQAKDSLGNTSMNTGKNQKFVPMLSDFNNDSFVNQDDLTKFIFAWQNNDVGVYYGDIGPANFSPPNLQPQRDSRIDFEDLVVFAQMWNWSHHNRTVASHFDFPVNVVNENILSVKEPLVLQPTETKQFSLQFKKLSGIQTLALQLQYDTSKLQIHSVSINENASALVLKYIDNNNGFAAINIASLNGNLDSLLQLDNYFNIAFTCKSRLEQEPLTIYVTAYSNLGSRKCVSQEQITFSTKPPIPKTFELSQNYPNPFNATTVIKYQLPKDVPVNLKIYNVLGEEVISLTNEYQKAGYYEVKWSGTNTIGKDVSSGTYFMRIQAGDFVKSKKMLLLK
jgi:hypothetical protein